MTKWRGHWLKRLSKLLFGLLVVACAETPVTTTLSAVNSTSTAVAETTTAGPVTTARLAFDRGDLSSFEPVEIDLGGELHWIALADTEAERAAGLMDIADVGDFTGMLFAWEEEINTGFWMKETRMPLDLFFYSATGDLVDQVSLVPCSADPCPVYVSEALFRWVLETPAGNLGPPLGPLTMP